MISEGIVAAVKIEFNSADVSVTGLAFMLLATAAFSIKGPKLSGAIP